MNKLLLATVAMSLVRPQSCSSNAIHTTTPVDDQVTITVDHSREDLIDAIIQVESGGNDSAVGDRGKAIGCLQIHPIAVREVNRILKRSNSNVRFSLLDRYNRNRSIQMFNIIAEQYSFKSKTSSKKHSETIARRWNGGPRGDKKRATIKYWNKVESVLQN